MELTQRLECTQDFSEINNDKIFPDQSISRHHAVINILSKNEFMLMDLDSANKTKLSGKTLLPYMPSPLKNGDMVQFGQVFGVFRLFEEENDLPMTQAINVPETPVLSRCISKLNIQVTTIPESPDFSDKDDSVIGASQQKQSKNMFKSPRDNFLKACVKTIEIKPIGTNKIDNVYWTSSKKSESFTSQANISNNLDDSSIPQNIHELQTQLPYDDKNNSNGSIYNALTQRGEERSLAIHEMETQLPADLPEVCKIDDQQNIQFDFSISENKENENIITNSEKDLPSENKSVNTESINTDKKSNSLSSENLKEKLDLSNDIILFDEVDSPPLEDNLESQSLMDPDIIINNENPLTCENNVKESEKEENYDQNINSKIKRRQSGDSTDCEDDIFIAMTQKLKAVTNDDDVTDCEDEPEPVAKSNEKEKATDENLTDCEDEPENVERPNEITENVKFEDMCTQVIEETPLDNEQNVEANIFKMPTALDDLQTQIIEEDKTDSRLIADLQTQVIEVEEDLQKNVCFEEALTQNIYSEEIMDFKMPGPSLRRKRKTVPNIEKQLSNIVQKNKTDCENEKKDSDNDEIYYATTQEPCIDLCTQRELSPESLTQNIYSEEIIDFKQPGPSPLRRKRKIVPNIEKQLSNVVQESKNDSEIEKKHSDNDDIYYAATQELFIDLCSQKELSPEIVKQPTITLNTNKKLSLKSPKENNIKHRVGHEFDEDCDIEEKINSFVANLSKSQIMDVVGTEKNLTAFKQKSNDVSDLKVPLKTKENNKINKISFKNESHKNEIKTKRSLPNKTKVKNYSEQNLRISNKIVTNHKRKEKSSSDIRSYLNKNTEAELLPSRSSSRIRKPTSRLKDSDGDSQKLCNSLFKSIIVIDDDETKKDIESVNTLQSKEEKKKTKTDLENKRKKAGKEKVEKDESTKEKITKSEHKPRRSRRTKEKDEAQKYTIEEELDVNKNKDSDVKKSRNSRSKSKKSENGHKNSKSPSNDKQKSDKKNREQSKEKDKKSPEKEIRRSKRQRTSKKSEESSSENKSHKISNGLEQSTIYTMSSESGIDSPNKLKRSGNFEYPSAKKTKTVTSLRSTPARKIKTHYVLFTAFPCEEVKNKLEKLGAIIVTEVSKCTVVLTMQIKRTFKLLCAVGLGRPVVGPAWVQACADTNMIVDPWLYLIKDDVTEKRFQFNLERSLVGKRNFLSGYNISSTPNVMPNAEEMKLIVECSGGKWKDQGPLWICVSCVADKSLWPTLKKKGAIIVSTEFILGGVLRQKLDIDKNRLM
ncbi:unnamed protein product, partial [Brenthis ino]